ncbi:YdcF family protein [Namhaeicola litoreus]|uniref:YdcF family protein n=1 Tax=Namhaeicola litoreus TaxID=1052145 RepID=A0ABW3Y3W5_9FLAO
MTQAYCIHVLGAGYDLDTTLPATSQLDLKTLGRLIEGIRVFKQLPNSILVTSGYAGKNLESQASVARRAAIALGVPKDKIEMLETPSTTWEEVLAFQQTFEDNGIPIIATDAAHMPRAMDMFRAAGYEPQAAPTNFKVKSRHHSYHGFSLPNVKSIQLMDVWLHEVLGELKWRMGVVVIGRQKTEDKR